MTRGVSIVGVPLDLGAGRRGVAMGPAALRLAEIQERLRELGYDIRDLGDVPVAHAAEPGDPRLKYLGEIRGACERLRELVRGAADEGRLPIVLGGDHSLAMGSIAGMSAHFRERGEKLGLIWFDAHADSNTAETSPSGNIHGMPLAVALGIGDPRLLALGGAVPMVAGENAALVGIRDVDVAERANLKTAGIAALTMRDIDERGMAAVMREAIERASRGTGGVHVSFDVDVIDPDLAKGTGTPARGGLTYREAHLAMELLADTGKVVSADFVEVNPALDNKNETARLAVELVASLLGKRIL